MIKIIIAGGDEAGRGAVIGPLVVSVVAIKKSREKKLSDVGVRDSKLLTRKRREFLYDEIGSLAEEIKVYKIEPAEINSAMASKISLNELEAVHFAKLIDALSSPIRRVYLDSPDVIPEKFGMRIKMVSSKPLKINRIRHKAESGAIKIFSEHKADSIYPVTSAASIIAKVVRDRSIDRIQDKIGIEIGSGYPSDMKTVNAIRENLASKTFMCNTREMWMTLKNIKQMKISEFLEGAKAPKLKYADKNQESLAD